MQTCIVKMDKVELMSDLVEDEETVELKSNFCQHNSTYKALF